MIIYWILALIMVLALLICCYKFKVFEEYTISEALIYVMVIIGLSICWPLFVIYLIIESHEKR